MIGDYEIPNEINFLAGDLIGRILVVVPRARYNIKKIRQHIWY